MVAQGRTGILVPLGDTEALSLSTCALLKDKVRLSRYGRQAKARAHKLFSSKRVGRRYGKLFAQLKP